MSKRTPPRPSESRRERQRRRQANGRPTSSWDAYGCQLNPRCVAGDGHDGDCTLWASVWDGLPDPHRHNPFGVAVVLAALVVGYTLCAGVVVAVIFGWLW